MLISVIEFGGFLGLRREFALDTADLPTEVAEEMYQLVADCGFYALPPSIRFNDGPDGFVYTVSVTDGEQFNEITLNLSAVSVPAELKNLMELAAQHANMSWPPHRHELS